MQRHQIDANKNTKPGLLIPTVYLPTWKLPCLVSTYLVLITSRSVLLCYHLVRKHFPAYCVQVPRHHSMTRCRTIPIIPERYIPYGLVVSNHDLTWSLPCVQVWLQRTSQEHYRIRHKRKLTRQLQQQTSWKVYRTGWLISRTQGLLVMRYVFIKRPVGSWNASFRFLTLTIQLVALR